MTPSSNPILITGVAGFVGFALAKRLLTEGYTVVGVDNINDYYDVKLKRARLRELKKTGGDFIFHKLDIANGTKLTQLILDTTPSHIIHLAAQAGVRYGLTHQQEYCDRNLVGHFNILAACKALSEKNPGTFQHLLYASSSSVYGGNTKVPFSETDDVSTPQSLYAATKRADELITHAWCNQFAGSPAHLNATGLRFFTVYGPWGRPDMSPVLFANAILAGKPIPLFNSGDLWRDFTYIDDIVEAIIRLMPTLPKDKTPHEIYNLGNQNPVKMTDFVQTLSNVLGKEAIIENKPWPPTEVYKTFADTSKLKAAIGWAPSTSLHDGLSHFAQWYKRWHGKFAV